MPDHVEATAVHNASTWGDVHPTVERNVSIDATTAWRCSSESAVRVSPTGHLVFPIQGPY